VQERQGSTRQPGQGRDVYVMPDSSTAPPACCLCVAFHFSLLQSRIYPFERATSSYPTSVVVLVVVITFIIDDNDSPESGLDYVPPIPVPGKGFFHAMGAPYERLCILPFPHAETATAVRLCGPVGGGVCLSVAGGR